MPFHMPLSTFVEVSALTQSPQTCIKAHHLTIIHLPAGLQNKTRNRIKMRKYFQPYSLLLKILLTDKDRYQIK